MSGIKELFNKPVGSDEQIIMASRVVDTIDYGEGLITLAFLVSIGFIPAIGIIHGYFGQLILAGGSRFLLDRRIDTLDEIRKRREIDDWKNNLNSS